MAQIQSKNGLKKILGFKKKQNYLSVKSILLQLLTKLPSKE